MVSIHDCIPSTPPTCSSSPPNTPPPAPHPLFEKQKDSNSWRQKMEKARVSEEPAEKSAWLKRVDEAMEGIQPLQEVYKDGETGATVSKSLALIGQADLLAMELPKVRDACSIEAAFTIIQYLRGAALTCDRGGEPVSKIATYADDALLAQTEDEVKKAYVMLAKAWMAMPRPKARKSKVLPEAMPAFTSAASELAQFSFTTVEVQWCDRCNEDQEAEEMTILQVKRRCHVSLTAQGDELLTQRACEIGEKTPAQGGVSATNICKIFFSEYDGFDRCTVCEKVLRHQMRVVDRLPYHLVVEDTSQTEINNISSFDHGAKFWYTDVEGHARPFEYTKTVAATFKTLVGPDHFTAVVNGGGLVGGGVQKDVQRAGGPQAMEMTAAQIGALNARVVYAVLRKPLSMCPIVLD